MSRAASDLEAALRALASVLDRSGRDWYLFGAQAVVIYGRPRATADIDVTVDCDLDGWTGLLGSLRDAGFVARTEALEAFVTRTRVIPLAHEATGIPVDLVLAGPAGLEREFLRRAQRMTLGDLSVPVIRAEDLIVSKILAGRPKDLEDVRGIFAERGAELDVGRVRRLLEAIEEALARRNLVQELERILT